MQNLGRRGGRQITLGLVMQWLQTVTSSSSERQQRQHQSQFDAYKNPNPSAIFCPAFWFYSYLCSLCCIAGAGFITKSTRVFLQSLFFIYFLLRSSRWWWNNLTFKRNIGHEWLIQCTGKWLSLLLTGKITQFESMACVSMCVCAYDVGGEWMVQKRMQKLL